MAHEHGGKSSSMFLPSAKIVSLLGLKGDEIVLDAGCGNGHLSVEAAKHAKKVYAYDTHEESIEQVQDRKMLNVYASVTDINNLDLDDNSVDAIILSNVLHGFIENKEDKAISELKRVLKKGGKILVVEFKQNGMFGPPKDIRLSPDDTKKIFKGYKQVAADSYLFNYSIVLQK